MAYGEFYVERQGWARWPSVLVMCRKRGDGIERRRYVQERTYNNLWKEFDKFKCSECSMEIGSISTNTIMPLPIRRCPNCGARVSEVDE